MRLMSDEDFDIVPLESDPSKGVKINTDLPDLEKRQLEVCQKENVDLFAWSAAEMPRIDLEIACHHLTVDAARKAVAQHKQKKSLEKRSLPSRL